jgi:tRNA pseudouridine38-40 synthase
VRYFFRVEYDGGSFGGWQVQTNAPSIQQTIEHAFATVVRSPCSIVGAGRTDAGVHARRQAAHFDLEGTVDLSKLQLSVNAVLPAGIAVFDLQPVPSDFNARFSALRRTYKYYICCTKRPLWYNRAWMMYYRVDWDAIGTQLQSAVGTRDFSAFCSSGSGAKHCVCTVHEASLADQDGVRVLTITANRFVYNMVRALTGTLIDIGRGAITASIPELIDGRDRSRAGTTAPAWGLVLDDVYYGDLIS